MNNLSGMLDHCWGVLRTGCATPGHPARTPVLATCGTHGQAEARMVVLRAVDRAGSRLEIHTDARSGKVAELARAPRATLLFWLPDEQFQIRLRVSVSVRPGSPEEWQAVPDRSRRAYGGSPAPGTPIPGPGDYDPSPDPAHFAVLEARVEEIEALALQTMPHARALFRQNDGFRGAWLAP